MTEKKISVESFNVKMLAAYMNTNVTKLAEICGIEPSHLRLVSAGKTKMTVSDWVKLSEATGIPKEQIEH